MSFRQLFRHSIFSQCLWYSQNGHSICRSSHSACRKSDLSIYEWNHCETETWDRRIPIRACKVEDKVIAMNRMMNRSATDQAVELFSNTVLERVGRPANLLWPFLMDLSFGSRLSRIVRSGLTFPRQDKFVANLHLLQACLTVSLTILPRIIPCINLNSRAWSQFNIHFTNTLAGLNHLKRLLWFQL